MAVIEKEEARGGRNWVARAPNGRSCKKHEEKGISNALVSNCSGCEGKVGQISEICSRTPARL